ncbi:MAG: Gp15 family bacteriophage protein [Anaerostipes hadrus]|nr:Gp15 family bacteriophage protein [uncultured Anaerostipes sp.]
MSVDIGSKKYEIDADFRTIMNIEGIIFGKEVTEDQKNFAKEMMQEVELNEKDAITNAKYYDALKIFYKDNIPDDLEEAMEKILWFYSCGKEETSKTKTKKKVISFEHDFDYINAGFMQDYKIDLFEVDFLHWWKFMSLFSALHDDCKICEIIGYRGAELKNFDKEQRKRIREMQKIYALPDDISKEEKKRQDEITQILLNGGDLSGIL